MYFPFHLCNKIFSDMFVSDRKFKTKNLGLAHGLSLAGNTLGGLIIPVVFAYLLDSWGYSGALLLSAAILLHTVPASLLLRFENHAFTRK
jgi:MFS family permease